jgi:hypothetical protein
VSDEREPLKTSGSRVLRVCWIVFFVLLAIAAAMLFLGGCAVNVGSGKAELRNERHYSGSNTVMEVRAGP